MKLKYKGVDIYPDVSVSMCYHTMYAEKHADELLIKLNDTRHLWDTWSPKKGDEISVEDDQAKSGKMYVESIAPSSGLITIRALSMPQKIRNKTCKSWEEVKFMQLLREVATKTGLTLSTLDVEDQTYSYVYQNNKSDFDFLYQRCVLEGVAFLVYDGKLVVYNEQKREQSPPTVTMKITPAFEYEYHDDGDDMFSKCEVTDGSTSGTYETKAEQEKVMRVVLPFKISSTEEANRFAQNLLRSVNKDMTEAIIYTDYMARNIAPGITVKLETEAAHSWDGTQFVTRVRHDYVHTKSKIWLRKGLSY